MEKPLKVLYECKDLGSKLPDHTQNVIVIILGKNWMIAGNTQDLTRAFLCQQKYNFLPCHRTQQFSRYPHVVLQQEEVSLEELLDILRDLGFELELPDCTPENWR